MQLGRAQKQAYSPVSHGHFVLIVIIEIEGSCLDSREHIGRNIVSSRFACIRPCRGQGIYDISAKNDIQLNVVLYVLLVPMAGPCLNLMSM